MIPIKTNKYKTYDIKPYKLRYIFAGAFRRNSMNINKALDVIKMMQEWAINKKLSIIIAGSVGYRSALLRNSELEKCDDIDCIFIYDDISQVSESPFYDKKFYDAAINTIPFKADMFSAKTEISGIKISADFVSSDYLKKLSSEEISGISKYRLKLTNAIEVPDNVYCNFYGEQTCYHKVWEEYQGYRIYKLPIHLFVNDVFFPGVLLSKYLFNPTCVEVKTNHEELIHSIQKKIKKYCPSDGSLCNAYYKCGNFSEETRNFLEAK